MDKEYRHLLVGGISLLFMCIIIATLLPIIGGLLTIFMLWFLYNIIKEHKKKKRYTKMQGRIAPSIIHDYAIGDCFHTLYVDKTRNIITIVAPIKKTFLQEDVYGYGAYEVFETRQSFVAVDRKKDNILCVKKVRDKIIKNEYDIKQGLKNIGIVFENYDSVSFLCRLNFVFIYDDKNKFIIIVTPEDTYFFKYKDVKRYSYVENGNELFNFTASDAGKYDEKLMLENQLKRLKAGVQRKPKHQKKRKIMLRLIIGASEDAVIDLPVYGFYEDQLWMNVKSDPYDVKRYNEMLNEVNEVNKLFYRIITSHSGDSNSTFNESTKTYSFNI
ncbi:MAG: hypothetical protein ACI3ZZ_00855 [Candidatus Aphodosoma sp.]